MEPNMKSKAVISAVMAVSLTTGGFAFAQGNGDRNDRGRNEQSQRGNQQDRRDNDRNDRARNNQSQHGGQHDSRDFGRAHNDERGAGPNHEFHRGERLPMEYRHRQYVVDDWRGHQLSAPPRGYHWVQTGADYVLVAIATGVILQLFLGHG
jgi:Ni/Co efflux regulator RcnB